MNDRQVALLRGINVGRAKRVAMADLRGVVEGLGYGNVQTVLNSGNVVYEAPGAAPADTAARIQEAVAAQLGVSARVTALSAAEIAAVVSENPLSEVGDNPSRLFVAVFIDLSIPSRLLPLAAQDWAPEALSVGLRAAYFWCPQGMLDSSLAVAVNRALGDAATTRNWATMQKLQALVEAPARPGKAKR